MPRGERCYLLRLPRQALLDGLLRPVLHPDRYSSARSSARPPRSRWPSSFLRELGYAHPRAIELAAKVAELAPGGLNRVFFVSGGSEANESMIKLVKPYHRLHGEALAART